jgi:hypothetical protein
MLKRRHKNTVTSALLLFALSWIGYPHLSWPAERELIAIVDVYNDKIVYETYKSKGYKEYDLSGLVVSKEIVGKGDPFNRVYHRVPDFKQLLLQSGYASLEKPESARPEHLAAQESAKSENKGQWAGSKEKAAGFVKLLRSWSISVWNFLKRWLPVAASIGLLSFVVKYLYKKFYIQRRLRLLIIGEPSAGKTALYLRLLDPKVDKKKILELSPTRGLQRAEKNTFIPKGKFELYPCVSDVPGSAFSTVWDEFGKSRFHAIILVLAPTIQDSRTPAVIDQKYIYTQLGYVQAYIEGGMGSHIAKRPKVIVVFINKFDLFSEVQPGDSAATSAEESLQEVFGEHIDSARMAGKKTGIPVYVLYGSALESWNCERIIDVVGQSLYGFK